MIERAIRHLYPMELSSDLVTDTEKDPSTLNSNEREYIPERTETVAAAKFKSGKQLNMKRNSYSRTVFVSSRYKIGGECREHLEQS